MKHQNFFRVLPLIALGALLVAACGDGGTEPSVEFGNFEGRWDDKSWKGSGYSVLVDDTLYLFGWRPDPKYYYTEEVRVQVAFHGPGLYELEAGDARLAKITGGDAGYFPGATGALRVTSHDEATGTIAGSVNLAADGPDGPWTFTNGAFRVPVYTSFASLPQRN